MNQKTILFIPIFLSVYLIILYGADSMKADNKLFFSRATRYNIMDKKIVIIDPNSPMV